MNSSFLPATILLLLFNYSAMAQGQERELQLATSIVNQQSCMVNDKVDALRLMLQLRYTNVGKEKLILYKGNRFFFQVFISRGGAEAAARKSELRATHARYFDEQPEKIVASAPGSVFTILSPGSSYETRQIVSVPVARNGDAIFNVSIATGEHLLSVASSTWYESKKVADNLRERWRTRGFLWTDPLFSNSVNFAVSGERSNAVCQ
jgi:hypothetical protein